MALPSRYGIEKKINSMEGLSAYENGGPGSGNFGHSGRPGEVGGSGKGTGGDSKGGDGKSGSSEQLSGPAKTHEEYTGRDASRDCKKEFSDTFAELSDHAYWIADSGEFADGYDAVAYERFGDKYGGMADRMPQARHTQEDLVQTMKRAREEAERYGVLDGSASTDMLNEWLDKYDMDGRFNSVDGVFENGGKGSGNFGHEGRPGEVGGSGKGGQISEKDEKKDKIDDLEKELGNLGETAEDLKLAMKRGEHGSEERLDDTEKKIKATQKKLKEAVIEKAMDLREKYYSADEKSQEKIREELSKLMEEHQDIDWDKIK